MRTLYGCLALLLLAGVASAQQVCTPIAMDNYPNITGSGTGPNYNFMVNGVWYYTNSGHSVRLTVPATVTFGDIHEDGYINVYGSFHSGGTCINVPWNATVSYQPKLIDLTTGVWVNDCCMQTTKTVNDVTGASKEVFYDYGSAGTPGTITLIHGHTYEWEMITSTYVYGLGRTPIYSGSVILTIE